MTLIRAGERIRGTIYAKDGLEQVKSVLSAGEREEQVDGSPTNGRELGARDAFV